MNETTGWKRGLATALLKRPDLWPTALTVGWRHVPDRWWAESPRLPMPDADWLDFRLETAFAHRDGRPDAHQFIEYLEWSRQFRSSSSA